MATSPGYVDDDIAAAFDDANRLAGLEVAIAEQRRAGPEPLTQYQRDPIGFFVDVLGDRRDMFHWSEAGPEYDEHEWDGDRDPLARIMEGLANGQSVACLSATGVGKSALAARAALWFLGSFKYARVPTYAPRKPQLTDYMWAEMGKLWPQFKARFPTALLQELSLYMDGDAEDRELWSAVGVPLQVKAGETVSTRAAGIHGPHMMLVLEEVEGIAPSVIEALENTCTAPHNFFFAPGNPNSKQGMLYRLATRPGWLGVRASGLDHPNVVCDDANIVPGAVSVASIVKRAIKYKVPADEQGNYLVKSPEADVMFKSRVRGIAPDQSKSALIRDEWIRAAVARQQAWIEAEGGFTKAIRNGVLSGWPSALGYDPSQSEEGDYAGEAEMLGPYTLAVKAAPCPNATDLGTRAWLTSRQRGTAPDCVGIDPIGIGAATVNEFRKRLEASGLPGALPRIEGSGKPLKRIARIGEHVDGFEQDANLFTNLRAQMYWQAMLDLQNLRVGLPDDPELHEELLIVEYDTDNGKTTLMPKSDIKDKLGRSPNKADAWVYCNWVRRRAAPLAEAKKAPDETHLGWKKVGNKVVPMLPEDVDRAVNPQAYPPATGGRWWRQHTPDRESS